MVFNLIKSENFHYVLKCHRAIGEVDQCGFKEQLDKQKT